MSADSDFAEVFSFPPATGTTEAESYQRFVDSMVPHCRCRTADCPCDGVLAGGLCDGLMEEDADRFAEDDDARDAEDAGMEFEP